MAQRGGTVAAMTGWVFASTMMIVVGVFQIIDGITAIFRDNFFVTVRNYTFNLDTTAWGWIHLALGALVLLTGIALMSGRTWAAVTGLVLTSLSAINNFFFLPYYPFWSILVIAADVFIIWSLARMLGAGSGGDTGRRMAAAPTATGRTEYQSGSTYQSGSAATDVKPRTTDRPVGGQQQAGTTGGQQAGTSPTGEQGTPGT
ncbi:MAG TPA: hypothetical protein VGN37_28930 [Actinocatenispora sp.]